MNEAISRGSNAQDAPSRPGKTEVAISLVALTLAGGIASAWSKYLEQRQLGLESRRNDPQSHPQKEIAIIKELKARDLLKVGAKGMALSLLINLRELVSRRT